MIRRRVLTRGEMSAAELAEAVKDIGVRQGQEFTITANVDGPAHCSDCGDPLNPNRSWGEVIGFDKPRAQGGTNHIVERRPTGVFLCDPCMSSRRAGLSPGQGSIL